MTLRTGNLNTGKCNCNKCSDNDHIVNAMTPPSSAGAIANRRGKKLIAKRNDPISAMQTPSTADVINRKR